MDKWNAVDAGLRCTQCMSLCCHCWCHLWEGKYVLSVGVVSGAVEFAASGKGRVGCTTEY